MESTQSTCMTALLPVLFIYSYLLFQLNARIFPVLFIYSYLLFQLKCKKYILELVALQGKRNTSVDEKPRIQVQTRNLLRIAIFNISYIRGLFPENYFNDKSVPALEMKIKKLMPMDAESRRLIDWMEKGVYDALQKKYLKTLLFCICENETGPMIEEYAFSFSYSDSSEVSMNVSRSGNKKQGTTFKSSSEDFSPNQIRSCACKMVRTLIQLMRTLDRMPDERTIIMKLCYYDEVTPQDYEPPFFRCCGEQEHNSWSKAPLKLKVGGVDSKHFMIALKVKSVLDPCEDDNENIYDDVNDVSLGDLELQDNDDSETQQEGDDAAMDLEEDEVKNPSPKYNNSSAVEEEMKEVEEEDNTKDLELVKDWILSRNMATVETTDVLCQFPEIPLVIVEDIMDILVKEKLLVQLGRDKYCIRFGGKANDDKATAKEENVMSRYTERDESEILYDKALSYTLTMDYISVSKLQSKFSDKINQSVARKMIERMVLDGYVDRASGNRRQGRRVLHSEKAKKKLRELKDRLSGAAQQGKGRGAIDKSSIPETPVSDRDGSTNGRLHSLGSEQTRYGQSPLKESPICGQKNSRISGSEFKKPASPDDQKGRMSKPTLSRESTVKYGKVNSDAEQMDLENMKCSQETSEWRDVRSRKTSMVREPIHQNAKRLKN